MASDIPPCRRAWSYRRRVILLADDELDAAVGKEIVLGVGRPGSPFGCSLSLPFFLAGSFLCFVLISVPSFGLHAKYASTFVCLSLYFCPDSGCPRCE